jgi:hypothetical protein
MEFFAKEFMCPPMETNLRMYAIRSAIAVCLSVMPFKRPPETFCLATSVYLAGERTGETNILA